MTAEQLEQSYGGRVRQRRPLTEIVQQLLDRIELAGGEVDDGVDALGLELEDKVSAYAAVIRHKQGDAAENRRMAAFYAARVDAPERAIVRLKELLKGALQAVAVEKIQTATCSVWLQESTSVEIADEARFMSIFGVTSFVRTTRSPDKTAIREAIDTGACVEGAKLVTTKHVRVR